MGVPFFEYEHRACPVCGAATDNEASTRCKQTQDITGEWNCPGGAEEESYSDGRLRFVTADSLSRMNAHYDFLADGASDV